ncbi:CBS domain-containing protein [Methanobrevibacter sp.]|uniref:CBS domain-containing protein n=1 Tax=Methanobrevibacter sp. TaxID=66852 RepID=UPI0038910C48
MTARKVSEIMTRDVITTTPEIDVVYAFEKLMEHKISSLPVVDDGKLVGIITATDVGHNLILDKYELGTKVEEIMIKDVITISPDDSLETAIEIMKEAIPGSGILNQLPIVEGDKLVGIISDGDIIQEVF